MNGEPVNGPVCCSNINKRLYVGTYTRWLAGWLLENPTWFLCYFWYTFLSVRISNQQSEPNEYGLNKQQQVGAGAVELQNGRGDEGTGDESFSNNSIVVVSVGFFPDEKNRNFFNGIVLASINPAFGFAFGFRGGSQRQLDSRCDTGGTAKPTYTYTHIQAHETVKSEKPFRWMQNRKVPHRF